VITIIIIMSLIMMNIGGEDDFFPSPLDPSIQSSTGLTAADWNLWFDKNGFPSGYKITHITHY
jgi:hypothetical protein